MCEFTQLEFLVWANPIDLLINSSHNLAYDLQKNNEFNSKTVIYSDFIIIFKTPFKGLPLQ